MLISAPVTMGDVWEALLRQPSWQSVHLCLKFRIIVDKACRDKIFPLKKLSKFVPSLLGPVSGIKLAPSMSLDNSINLHLVVLFFYQFYHEPVY